MVHLKVMNSIQTAYNEIPYPTTAYMETQIERLQLTGWLFGLDAPPARACRVLEIGCGDGGNLLPMAVRFAESQFVGIDLAPLPVAKGAKVVQDCGLTNVTLHAMDLMDLPAEWGQFDYIIAHGFYSWVPDFVREKLWQVLSSHLSPNGIAFTSYNALPGSRFRQISRDMMQFHLEQVAKQGEPPRSRRSLEVLEKVAENAKQGELWQMACSWEWQRLNDRVDSLLSHDELGSCYFPFYLHEVVGRATQAGLQYLGEGMFPELTSDRMEQVRNVFGQAAAEDVVVGEQYYDFLKGSAFRRTLLCRSGHALRRQPMYNALWKCWIRSPLRFKETAPDGGRKYIHMLTGKTISTNNQALIAMFEAMAQAYPRALPVADLMQQNAGLLPEAERQQCLENLLLLGLHFRVELQTGPFEHGWRKGGKPLASPLVRLQATQRDKVVNLEHVVVDVSEKPMPDFLQLLDGTRDYETLVQDAAQQFFAGDTHKAGPQVERWLTGLNALSLLL